MTGYILLLSLRQRSARAFPQPRPSAFCFLGAASTQRLDIPNRQTRMTIAGFENIFKRNFLYVDFWTCQWVPLIEGTLSIYTVPDVRFYKKKIQPKHGCFASRISLRHKQLSIRKRLEPGCEPTTVRLLYQTRGLINLPCGMVRACGGAGC